MAGMAMCCRWGKTSLRGGTVIRILWAPNERVAGMNESRRESPSSICCVVSWWVLRDAGQSVRQWLATEGDEEKRWWTI